MLEQPKPAHDLLLGLAEVCDQVLDRRRLTAARRKLGLDPLAARTIRFGDAHVVILVADVTGTTAYQLALADQLVDRAVDHGGIHALERRTQAADGPALHGLVLLVQLLHGRERAVRAPSDR